MGFAYTAIFLGVLVTVHELGHFLVAKALNVKVLRFSIGFGPALFKVRRGETEYQLSALPLGGYVKMAGDMPHEELPPEEAHRGFLAQAPWKRGLIVAAGPAFNLIFPVLVYFFVFFGAHERESTRVGSVSPGLPAAEAGVRPGDRIVRIDGTDVRTFEELRNALQPTAGQEVVLGIERDGQRFDLKITPKKNVEKDLVESTTRGMIGVSPYPFPPVVGVPADSPAYQAGLRSFDRILSINGKPVPDEAALTDTVRHLQGTLKVEVLRGADAKLPAVIAQIPQKVTVEVPRQEGDGYAALGVERHDLYLFYVAPGSAAEKAGVKVGDRLVAMNGKQIPSWDLFRVALQDQKTTPFALSWRSGTEEKTAQVTLAPLDLVDELGAKMKDPVFGASPRPYGAAEEMNTEKVTEYLGVADAFVAALKIVPEKISLTMVVLGRLLSGDIPFKNVGGPIMLYDIAVKSAAAGLDVYLNAMAMISINLGIMNLLPIPILDGFHLIAAIWEGIRRRPIPVRAREIANWVGLCMLILLMVMVFKNDITR